MSTASMKKRVRAALGGLALLTLSAAFNSAAMADEATPPAPAPVTETVTVEEAPPIVPTVIMTPAPTAAEAALNAAVAADMVAIGEAMKTAYEADPRYDAAADSAVQQQIDDLITRVNSGANGNVFPQPDGLSVLGGAGMSSFATAVSIAVDTGRVDLVNAFIDAGADVSQIAPDGWRPMDYAISSFINGQATNRAHAEAAFAIIRVLESHGAKMSDAVEVGKLFTPDGQPPMVFDTYGKLINNLIGMDVVQRAVAAPADITVQGRTIPLDAQQALFGTQETAVDLSDEVRLRRAFILNNGGRLIHETYTDAYPGGAEQHTVMTGETLVNLATRYYAVMGERSPLHAMSRIMQANDLPADSRLRRGQRILIPVSENIQIGMIQAREEMDIRDLAEDIINMGTFYIPGATKDVIIRELARVNGIPEADIVSGTYKHPRGKPFIMLYDNDTFRHMQPLTPPTDIDPNRRIDLVIIEQQDGEDYHRKRTYGAATATAYAINRDVDMLRFFAWQEHLMSYPPELR
ncbi:MAG: LysM peptidoglycan-binding domain-containing protein, partial [Alphaproteobacteria bacterium]|nr:LysM peptidoglycan-binding domain-containing protein [Alphaproteobacteria bacterium]